MKKFCGPEAGPYEQNTGIGEIPTVGPCDVKGLTTSEGTKGPLSSLKQPFLRCQETYWTNLT